MPTYSICPRCKNTTNPPQYPSGCCSQTKQEWQREVQKQLCYHVPSDALATPPLLVKWLIQLQHPNLFHFLDELPVPPDFNSPNWPWDEVVEIVDIQKARRQFEDTLRKLSPQDKIKTIIQANISHIPTIKD